MKDVAAFVKLIAALSPWSSKLVVVGGWAHRLHRLHPSAATLPHLPLATLDADIAFAERDRLDGNIKDRLLESGFTEHLTGTHHPPVSHFTLGEDGPAGFYAEFLTTLKGREVTNDGARIATIEKAGVTAQRLRYLDLLLIAPWSVSMTAHAGDAAALTVRVPNPVSFIVQKLLIHDDRTVAKRSQDVLYIHDTLELFAAHLDEMAALWRHEVSVSLHLRWVQRTLRAKDELFGRLNDRIRSAAVIPQDRDIDPERMRLLCLSALGDILH